MKQAGACIMQIGHINYLAVFVSAVLYMAIGFCWYSMKGFGKSWMHAIGKKIEDLNPDPKVYLLTFFGAMITSYILAHVVYYTGATTFIDGIISGLWVGLGFSATTLMITFLFEHRPKELFLIDAGYQVIAIALMAGLLAAWS